MFGRRNSRDAKNDREFTLGNRRNMSRLVIWDQSVAEETHSATGVRSQARRTNDKWLEGSACNWFEVYTGAYQDVRARVHRLSPSQC